MLEFLKEIEEIEFFSIEDLYDNKEFVREKIKELDPSVKKVYKWYYFYQLCLLDERLKSAMWDYLNDIGDETPLNIAYLKFKLKKEKYHQKYLLEKDRIKEEDN